MNGTYNSEEIPLDRSIFSGDKTGVAHSTTTFVPDESREDKPEFGDGKRKVSSYSVLSIMR